MDDNHENSNIQPTFKVGNRVAFKEYIGEVEEDDAMVLDECWGNQGVIHSILINQNYTRLNVIFDHHKNPVPVEVKPEWMEVVTD
jgi:hypothetical protein